MIGIFSELETQWCYKMCHQCLQAFTAIYNENFLPKTNKSKPYCWEFFFSFWVWGSSWTTITVLLPEEVYKVTLDFSVAGGRNGLQREHGILVQISSVVTSWQMIWLFPRSSVTRCLNMAVFHLGTKWWLNIKLYIFPILICSAMYKIEFCYLVTKRY